MSDHWQTRRFGTPNYHQNQMRPRFSENGGPRSRPRLRGPVHMLQKPNRMLRNQGMINFIPAQVGPHYSSPPIPFAPGTGPQNADFSRPPPPIGEMVNPYGYGYVQQINPQPPLPSEPPPPPPPLPPGTNDWMSTVQHRHWSGPPPRNSHNFTVRPRPEKPIKRRPPVDDETETMIPRKKPMSKFYPTKPWNKFDAEKAHAAELKYSKRDERSILVRFPEPDITSDMVLSLNSSIEGVHFQNPGQARFCFIQPKEGVDHDALMEQLNKTDFYGRGLLCCEPKAPKHLPAEQLSYDTIDPYTLYLGNLPISVPANSIKEKFSTSQRVDIGFAQRMKCTRYAFIRYHTVEEAIEAFKFAVTLRFDSRSLIVRFRRQKGKGAEVPKLSKKELMLEKQKIMFDEEEVPNDEPELAMVRIKQEPIDPDLPDDPNTAGLEVIRNEDLLDNNRLFKNVEVDEEDENSVSDSSDDSDMPHSRPLALTSIPSRPILSDDDTGDESGKEDEDSDREVQPTMLAISEIKQEKIDEDETAEILCETIENECALPVPLQQVKTEEEVAEERRMTLEEMEKMRPPEIDPETSEDDDDDDD